MVVRIEFAVVAFQSAGLDRLLLAKTENPENPETLEQDPMDPRLKFLVKINQNVAAKDHVELVKRGIGREIVLREHDVFSKRRIEFSVSIPDRVVGGEIPPAAGAK